MVKLIKVWWLGFRIRHHRLEASMARETKLEAIGQQLWHTYCADTLQIRLQEIQNGKNT